MWGGKIKLNQCQDCGCPGAQLIVDMLDDNAMQVRCPYCGRKGSVFIITRGNTKFTPFSLMEASWNPYNRENKEGLG